MIISHKYKFIFIKTNKTAGTSIEIALSRFCGADDIITPVWPEDERTRRELGYRGPQNYLAPIWDYRLGDVTKLLMKGQRKCKFYNHISAGKVRGRIGEQAWNSYYKFCFERNPWDRVLSLYYWRHSSEPRPTISDFLESNVPLALKRKGFELYTIDGQIAVDKVCRFENISEELEAIRKQVGIPEQLDLPHAKSQFRKDKRNYRDILDVGQQAKIAELFSDEIRLFGYEFEPL
jgi:sulfotransferase famil protein